MQKRGKSARVVLALMLSATMILAGCSTNWVQEAEQIVAAMIPAAANLVTLIAILEGKTVTAEDLAMVQSAGTQAGADLQLIQSLIAAYDKADDAARPGILNQIQSAVNAAQANLQGLLPALHIKDAATQTKVAAVVGILLSEVQSLAAVVPGAGVVAQAKNPHFSQKQGEVGHPKAPLSAREFVKSYNATLTAKTGNAGLDEATSGLQIHEHGAVARWSSAGLLK
jgi:hypothetical protein